MANRIVIDCDPGIDDAMAILFAVYSPEVHLDGITVVAGNTLAAAAAHNALGVLDAAGATKVPVFAGAAEPLERKHHPSPRIHGEDGLGDCGWPASRRQPRPKPAADFLIEQGQKLGANTVLVCLGPLTNIAQAIARDPESMSRYSRMVIMGGAHRVSGNTSPVAEHNFWTDPEAAQRVVEWRGCPMTLVGLDVTRTTVLSPNHRELLRQMNTEITHWVWRSTRHFLNAHWQVEQILGCYLADPLAVAAAILPQYFETQQYPASVAVDGLNRGQLVLDEHAQSDASSRPGIQWCVKVDRRRFIEEFLSRLGPKEWTPACVRRCLVASAEE